MGEAATSIVLEHGVICTFPMQNVPDSTKIQLVGVYADQKAYEAHPRPPIS